MGICYSQPLPITQEKGDEMTGAEAEKYSMPLVIPAEKTQDGSSTVTCSADAILVKPR